MIAYVEESDRRLEDVLANAELDRPGHPLLDRAEAVFTIIEHEEMHQETLQYIWHRLPLDSEAPAAGHRARHAWTGAAGVNAWRSPPGTATLGDRRAAVPFGWDNEFGELIVDVPAFTVIGTMSPMRSSWRSWKTAATGASRCGRRLPGRGCTSEQVAHPLFWERHDGQWHWRGMFDLLPLPPAWPVYVSHAEAEAFARWRGAG